jgi:tungstate transport system substrate-binding protein
MTKKMIGMALAIATLAFWQPFALAAAPHMRLATTTSVENSGLLATLLPSFEAHCGCKVDVIAVGTGHALALGKSGDVDAVLVHAPKAEQKFVREGYGVQRTWVMENDFIIVGPADDPAGVGGTSDVSQALTTIAGKMTTFISRGDGSGTHIKEQSLWAIAKINPTGEWYLKVGQGMGRSLIMGDQKKAYLLTDRGTYLSMANKLSLVPLVTGDRLMVNPYGIIAVNPDRHPTVQKGLADQLVHWITSPSAQKQINTFRINGEVLFRTQRTPGTGD